RPVRPDSTSAPGCAFCGKRTSGRRSSVQPAELAVRAPTPRDAAGIADVLNAHAGAAGARIHAPANEGDDDYRAALSRHGFRVVRSSFTMEIDLERPTEEPVWPGGLMSRGFVPGEERAVYDAYAEAFADHWGFVPES